MVLKLKFGVYCPLIDSQRKLKIGTEELLFCFLVLCYMRCLKKGKREEEHKFEKVNDDVWIGGVLVKCELKGKKDLCVLYGRLIDIKCLMHVVCY